MVALYLNAVDETQEAWDVIERMETASPGHPDIDETTKEIFSYNLKHASRRMEEDEKTNKMVSGSFRQSIPASSMLPLFENKIIEELYKHDFRLPLEILKEILDLPKESLVCDLKKVLEDGIARYRYFKTDKNWQDKHTQFLLHAIFIIAEEERIDCLENIFNVLKNGDEFTEFYFGDTKTELLWIAIYKLAVKDVSLLFAFLKERNIDTFSKTPVNQALEQLFYHHENLRQPIIEGYRELSAYFIANKEDEALTDTNVIASATCTMRDIAVDELKEQIKELYEHNLVYYAYAGNYKSLMKHQRNEERKKKTIPSIYEMYEKIITTWAGYKDDEEGDDGDDNEGRDDDEANINRDGEGDWDKYWDKYWDKDMPNNCEDQKPFLRTEPKIGRNDPCPCGSGKKYKKCCMKLPETAGT
jgi:DNA-binding Lrp family transcriptional regulator